MIPTFPQFKKIELSEKEGVEYFTHKYAPYSDFNFMSMWAWDTHREMELSQLNENLVIKFTDYLNGYFFYSFLGETKTTETALALLDFSKEQGFELELKLVPEISVQKLDTTQLSVFEDRDHFDYILSLELLSTYPGHDLRGHASFQRRFLEAHGEDLDVKTLDLNNKDMRDAVLGLTKLWMINKTNDSKDFAPSLEQAVEKYFSTKEHDECIISVGLFHQGKLVAFTINELEAGEYSVCHFMKADNSFKGIYSCLVSETAKELLKHGKKYINFEQDLGLKNLRQSKKTYQPVDFLKKYKVTRIG